MPLRPTQRDLFGHRPAAPPRTRAAAVMPFERGRRALSRHGWVMAVALGLCCGAGALVYRGLQPIYRVSASVELQSPAPAVNFARAPAAGDRPAQLDTAAEELGSRSLVASVAQRFGPGIESRLWRWRPWRRRAAGTAPAALTGAALRQLAVAPVGNSQLIQIQFEAPAAQLAARFVNGLIAADLQAAAARARGLGLARVKALSERAEAARQQVAEAQQSIQDFSAAHGLADPGAALGLENHARQQLATAAATARIAAVQRAAALAQKGDEASAAPVEIAARRAGIAAEIGRLSAIYKPEAAPLRQARQELAGLDASLAGWQAQNHAAAQRALAADREQARELSAALIRQARGERELTQTLADFDLARRELQARQDAYSGLLDQLQQAAAEVGDEPPRLRVVDPAVAPVRPIRPNLPSTLASSLVLGLLLGGGVVWLWEWRRAPLGLAEAAEIGVPLLALLPEAAAVVRGSGDEVAEGARAARRQRAFERGLDRLATVLALAQAEAGVRVVLITSAGGGAGKSALAQMLAQRLAQTSANVLLLDATSPAAGQGAAGVGELLAGRAAVEQVLRREGNGENPGFFFIPAGMPDRDYAVHLASGAGNSLLAAAGQRYDWVILDGGAVSAGPAAAIWANLADTTLLVAERGRSSRRRVRHALDVLEASGAVHLGLILNRAPEALRTQADAWLTHPYPAEAPVAELRQWA